MPAVSIIEVEPASPELREILRLHRAATNTLGFLPFSGFTERALRGTLLAALDDGCVAGYSLYDLTGDRVKLRHLCVDPSARRNGVARRLVDELIHRHADRRSIELACRRDFGLDGLWKALGFHPVYNRPGRSRAGHLLTVWLIDFGHPTLFSAAPSVGDLACLDQMVLEDLVVERPQGLHSRYLLEDWVEELVEFCVTDEVHSESNDTIEDELRGELLAAASTYRNLSRTGAPWSRHVDAVAALTPRAGQGDHRHVARAIEGGAVYFVTRDDKLLEGADRIFHEFGVVVVSPEGLVDRLDRQRSQDRYEPAVLQGTDLTEELLPANDQDAFVAALLNHGEGERAHRLRAALRSALADRNRSEARVIRDANGDILGGVIRTNDPGVLTLKRLRVRRLDRLADTIARQLVFGQRATAADGGLTRVIVTDPSPSSTVLRALDAEGFSGGPGQWICEVGHGIHAARDLLGREATAADAAAYERLNWPAKLIGADLTTFMISIEPSYAERLFEANLADATLFSRDPVLGLSREHVYYRPPGTTRSLAGPARVLWYVKGGKAGHRVGHVRAVSHLLEVVCDRPRTLYNRYARLGVWNQRQVEQAARRTGQAMALRLTDTELLERPLSLPVLRAVYAETGATFHAPQAPVRVSERMFCLLYRRSSRYV
jgi:GNAT superfamily N-acetyltransferase